MNTEKILRPTQRLARRFQQILVEEPSIEDTISILRGLKEKYEVHHGVKILDSAIVSLLNFRKDILMIDFFQIKQLTLWMRLPQESDYKLIQNQNN